jgi:hypothetical protein
VTAILPNLTPVEPETEGGDRLNVELAFLQPVRGATV